MIRYYIDSEFMDTGSTIELISIGIVADDGREYYAQSAKFFDVWQPTPWLREHVIPYLSSEWTERATIAQEIRTFMDVEKYGKPEWYGWCASYDFVVLCQLYGTMMDLPSGFPHYIRDVQFILDSHGVLDEQLPPQEEPLHNALADARYVKKLCGLLRSRGPVEDIDTYNAQIEAYNEQVERWNNTP